MAISRDTSLAAYINNMVKRGKSNDKINELVRQSFRGVKTATIANHIAYYRNTMVSARRFAQSGQKRPLSEVVQSSRRPNFSKAQVTYRFTFYDKERERWRLAGFSTDVSSSLTKSQVIEHIKKKMKSWLDKNYKMRDNLGRFRTQNIKDFEIRSIEGV